MQPVPSDRPVSDGIAGLSSARHPHSRESDGAALLPVVVKSHERLQGIFASRHFAKTARIARRRGVPCYSSQSVRFTQRMTR